MVYSNNAPSLGLKTGMELRFLLLLLLLFYIPGFQAQEHDAVESRVEGQNLSVECRYSARRYRKIRKAWCQLRHNYCSPLVSTYYKSKRRYKNKRTSGRAVILDNTRNGIVTITMKMLQVQDSGVYWCARYDRSNTFHRLKTIKLEVSKEYTAIEGQSPSVQCPYNTQDYKGAKKAWCRWRFQNKCEGLVNTDYRISSYQNKFQNERSMIQDDIQKGVVTITMEKLQVDDSGVYWCGLYNSPSIHQIIEVKLDVTKAPTTSDIPVTRSTDHTSPVLSTASAGLSPRNSSSLESRSTILWLGVGLLINKTLLAVIIALQVRRIRTPQRKHPDTNKS